MRKALLLVLTLTMTIVAVAADITPDAARQQATQFVIEQFMSGKAFRRSSAQPQLTMATRQSGLYVFNVDNGNGYVIVADDDRAETILGYSNSGSFDPQRIPSNMRAWLQGYADEIAWLKEHEGRTAPIMATKRSIKQAIAPLVKTLWNQTAPYNNMCPYYKVNNDGYLEFSETGGDGWKHCATGCVATAMAQVMKYHEWPQEATKSIPSYKWDNADTGLSILNPTTFDWSNMADVYNSGNTDAQNAAVAELMKYCGYSVKMNYGPESGSNTDKVADALKSFYDYNSTTTFVRRTHYSYNKWIDLLYNELLQGRPVVYGGASSGGGHEFVCDGYQGEDYFHINWGWGGTSDDYFKLSALNPYKQGVGGSSSQDGFHYGQDAVVGIQPSTKTGTVLDVSKNEANLTLNSFTLSATTIALGESVEATINVTNNSSDEYDGDIIVYAVNYGELAGKTFLIPAGETKEFVITVTPGKKGTYTLSPIYGDFSDYIQPYTAIALTVTEASGSTNPTTDDITLGRSLSIENSEVTSGKYYNVYGKSFKGILTVSNPDADYDFYGTYQHTLFKNRNYGSPVLSISQRIRVPANGSITIPVEYSGMEYGSEYELDVVYIRNGATGWDEVGFYTAMPGVIAYNADGTETVTKTSGNTFEVPASALAVDLTDTGVTAVTPNEEPNVIYILGSNDTDPANAQNIIRYDGTEYTAGDITLKDGNDFYSPVDFTAQNVEFTYNFTVAADGTNGWNTIMLPFDVTKVTADGVDIDWFHSSTDTGKNFWLKEYTGDEGQTVNFDFADKMKANILKANIPYIVAFPGNKWGKAWDMSNKKIKFIGKNVAVSNTKSPAVVTANNYRFVGSTTAQNTSNIYVLNADGNQFVSGSGSGAFRAFFKPGIYDRSVNSLTIGSKPADGTTGIENIENRKSEIENYYNLNGQRVSQPAKGIYIHNGRKVIIK
ncbi:MAG: C10 family peptidase [Prevotella sp.]|nr:C10 family peptidase [Prevotella sp.]